MQVQIKTGACENGLGKAPGEALRNASLRITRKDAGQILAVQRIVPAAISERPRIDHRGSNPVTAHFLGIDLIEDFEDRAHAFIFVTVNVGRDDKRGPWDNAARD